MNAVTVRERVGRFAFSGERGRVCEAVCSAACTAVVILLRPRIPVLVSVALVFTGAVLAIDLARREHRRPSAVRPLAFVIGTLLLIAVAIPPHFPSDIRAYEADGRIVAHYHRNPYVVAPGALAPDPAFAHVHNATAPYGPLFIGGAAVVSEVSGGHASAERLWYQAGAAIAIGAALVLLWRVRRSTAALVLVGLHPVVAGIIVNGGHNDAFIGLALLAAVLAAERRRFAGAGAILAAAMLVKITAGLALIPMAAWVATRHGRRALVPFLAPAAIVVVPITLAVPGLLTSLHAANFALVTRTSVWNMYPLRGPLLPRFGDGAVTQLSLVCVGAAVVVVSRGRRDLGDRVTGAAAAWLVLSAYVMPWYTVWALPVGALGPQRPLTRVVAWQGAVVVSAFLIPYAMLANRVVSFTLGWIAPTALLVAFVHALRTQPVPAPQSA